MLKHCYAFDSKEENAVPWVEKYRAERNSDFMKNVEEKWNDEERDRRKQWLIGENDQRDLDEHWEDILIEEMETFEKRDENHVSNIFDQTPLSVNRLQEI